MTEVQDDMLIIILLIVNIPVYIFIGWIVFDSPGKATDSFVESLIELLKTIFWGVSGDTFNLFPMFAFLVGCLVTVVGEHYLLQTYVFAK